MAEAPEHRPIVTLSAQYGASGSLIGPEVAERLGVPFVDRGIPRSVAERTGLPEVAVAQVGEEPRSRLSRFASAAGRLSTLTGEGGGSMERLDAQEREVLGHVEALLLRTRSKGGVVLGHAGVAVLGSVRWALHVALHGPRDARVRRAASTYGIDERTAAHRLKETDHARREFVSHAYGVDIGDLSLYHLVLDSTALSRETCVDVIALAATARARDASA